MGQTMTDSSEYTRTPLHADHVHACQAVLTKYIRDPDALAFVRDVLAILQIWDDVVDGDRGVEAVAIA